MILTSRVICEWYIKNTVALIMSQMNTCDWITCDRRLITSTAGLGWVVQCGWDEPTAVWLAAHYLTYSTSRLVEPVHTHCWFSNVQTTADCSLTRGEALRGCERQRTHCFGTNYQGYFYSSEDIYTTALLEAFPSMCCKTNEILWKKEPLHSASFSVLSQWIELVESGGDSETSLCLIYTWALSADEMCCPHTYTHTHTHTHTRWENLPN